jgi:hypothetical protein
VSTPIAHQQVTHLLVSGYLVNGALLTYIGGLFLMIAFCSPYWVKSFDETFSQFKNMGLWEYCFDNFRYPYYQFDHLFDGCHHVFSREFYVIREWLLPPWLMAVQAFVTMSFLLSFGCQVMMALQLVRWPLEFVLQYEWILSTIDFVCVTTTSSHIVFLFFILFTHSIFFQLFSCFWPWLSSAVPTSDATG